MHTRKALAMVIATVLAIPPMQVAATSLARSQTGVEGSVTYTAGKKRKKARAKTKATRAAALKSCGTFMYRKDGKCVDARAKK
jgi:hypothetical protein